MHKGSRGYGSVFVELRYALGEDGAVTAKATERGSEPRALTQLGAEASDSVEMSSALWLLKMRSATFCCSAFSV